MAVLRALTPLEKQGDPFEVLEKTKSHAAYEVFAVQYNANLVKAGAIFTPSLVADVEKVFKIKCSGCGAFSHLNQFCPLEKVFKKWVNLQNTEFIKNWEVVTMVNPYKIKKA